MKRFDNINVIPFIDIMLVMLAIVLTTASFISQGSLDINVPTSSNGIKTTNAQDQINIAIDHNQHLYFQEKPVSLLMLEEALNDLPKNIKMILKVDKNIPFQQFISVLDVLKKKQFKNLSIITEKTL